MFGQLDNVNPTTLKDFLMILMGLAVPLAALAGNLLGRRKSVRVDPQPLEVRPSAQYVTQELWREGNRSQAVAIDDMRARVTALEHGQQAMVEAIDRRMGEMRGELAAGLRGVHERVDNTPLEIVTLLRNTGAIK
jgi:hypothetical protein